MKKIITSLFLFLFTVFVILILSLSTFGIQTDKFNNLISNKASQSKNIDLVLETIKFKIDPKKFSLFLETESPIITYRNISLPVQSIKVYVDFFSLFKSDPKIIKTNIILDELDITKLSKFYSIIKPSNLKSILKNKIKGGKLISEIEIFLNEDGDIKNFISKGTIKNLKIELLSGVNLTETNFTYFADKEDILIKNIFGKIEDIKISDGDIKLNLENGVKIYSNFLSEINFSNKNYFKYKKIFGEKKFIKRVKNLDAVFNNNLSIIFDETYKIEDYNYRISGKIKKSKFELIKPIKNNFIIDKINEIYFSNLEFQSIFSPGNSELEAKGKYSLDNINFLKLNLVNKQNKNSNNLKLDFAYKNGFEVDLINYKKTKDSVADISLALEKIKNNIQINQFNFAEGNNSIQINDLKFEGTNFISFKDIKVQTKDNDFMIKNEKKIIINGTKFDATNLAKFFSKTNNENKFKRLNSDIEIDFTRIKIPLSETLKDFKLIGKIEKGKFIKVISKGDFGDNNFLDISIKKDKNSNKKYLEIYSDLTKPLLTEYSFFKGLSGGKLLFTSIIDEQKSFSKLKIENFKIVNAPGVIKLLSLADLSGLADLAEGEGLSFDVLEIDMEKNKNFLKLNEILSLGPSISVLMEGYQDGNGLTSLRGTLVPAKTFNKIISKIPVIGDIVIPKEVGEGLFGISFKIKGTKGKMKTTINPIRTLTPRFIQKIIDKKRNLNNLN